MNKLETLLEYKGLQCETMLDILYSEAKSLVERKYPD